MRTEKILAATTTILVCFLMGLALFAAFWSLRHLPNSPLRDPTPSMIPHLTTGNVTSILCFGAPSSMAILSIANCYHTFHKKNKEEYV